MEELAKNLGADIFGVADLDLIRDYPTIPENLLENFSRSISIGVKVSDAVFDISPLLTRYMQGSMRSQTFCLIRLQ